MRTRHDLLDVSDFFAQRFLCACGHWTYTAPWALNVNSAELYEEHLRLWAAAEAELDEAESNPT